jgi:FtsZ-interacting cell division protein ZipA
MDGGVIVLIVIVVVVLVALGLLMSRRRRTQQLQDRFGPEYERAVTETGDRKVAESELLERQARRDKFDVVPLDPAARERYLEEWHRTQALFVDSPAEATREADRLIIDVMRERGYPVDDFEQRAADVSVDHPQVVDDYRAARTISAANDKGEASTEDLRQALVHYRSLFEELLDTGRPDQADHPIEEAR